MFNLALQFVFRGNIGHTSNVVAGISVRLTSGTLSYGSHICDLLYSNRKIGCINFVAGGVIYQPHVIIALAGSEYWPG